MRFRVILVATLSLPYLLAAQPAAEEYKTVDKAITTKIQTSAAASSGQTGYLGVSVKNDAGKLVVDLVQPESPAAKADVKPGDQVLSVDGREATGVELFRGLLQSKGPGESVKLKLKRDGKDRETAAVLTGTSRPLKLASTRAVMGIRTGERDEGDGVNVDAVTPDSPAAKAGLKMGDVVLKFDGNPIAGPARVTDFLSEKKAGDVVTVTYRRDTKEAEVKVTLTADGPPDGRAKGNWDDRIPTTFRKEVYRLAVIGVEFEDVKHSGKITLKDWTDSLFSKGTYTDKSATGQKVYGSVNDYYLEQSHGKLRLEGKMFDWIKLPKKKSEYGSSSGAASKGPFLNESIEALLKRDGKDALKDFDGIFFLYAGDRASANRGSLYWPHRANFSYQGKRWSYFIVPEGGARMTNISVICHEFGHMLGLPDLYARPENPGSEGVGVWCAMSNQNGRGQPQHFSAWCKIQLGWIQPTTIDPTVRQKLELAPIEDSPKDVLKVLARPDGSEYFLLENRRRKGFDAGMPADGLLIWRVVQNKLILEESHGVEGPTGPRVFLGSVPFPSAANNAFTPYTTPSSRSQLGGGFPVHITNIAKQPDGKIRFQIGYEYE
jgi:M6 family metalloprotease-like protein